MTWLKSRLMGAVAALGVLVMVGGFGYVKGHLGKAAAVDAAVAKLTAQYQAATAKAANAALAKQTAMQTQYAAIDARHAQELNDAKQDAADLIAGLKSGNLRLRDEWTACRAGANVPQAFASADQPDATADGRADLAAAVVQAGAEAAAKIRALQAIVKADRQ